MKMTALKPIYLNRDVVLAGQEFDTLEQHGRELIKKGYAEAVQEAPAPLSEPSATDFAPETDTQAEAPAPLSEPSATDFAPETDTQAEAPAPEADVKAEAATKGKTK